MKTVIKREIMESFPVVRLRQAAEYHSDPRQAGDTAARAGVKTFVLNHPVPAPPPGTEQEWIDEAAENFDGEIHMAHDLSSLTA